MIQFINKIFLNFRNLILYGIFGSVAALTDYITFYLLTEYISLYYLISNIISVIIGINISFFLNRNFNFKIKDNTSIRFILFLLVGLLGMVLSSIILFFCIDIMVWNKNISKLLSIIIVVGIQFLINKHITFKK